jgi:hypothetical protein
MSPRTVLQSIRPVDAAMLLQWPLLAVVGLFAGDRLAMFDPPETAFQPPSSGLAFVGYCMAIWAIYAFAVTATATLAVRTRMIVRAPLLM